MNSVRLMQNSVRGGVDEDLYESGNRSDCLCCFTELVTPYTLNKQSVNSKLFIDSIYSQIAALAAFKKLTIDFKTHNLPESFDADSDLLQRAVLNIASNAIDYSPENAKIDFNVETIEDNIYFCIVDCGKGFSPDALKNAAQQFYMADKSRTSKGTLRNGIVYSQIHCRTA